MAYGGVRGGYGDHMMQVSVRLRSELMELCCARSAMYYGWVCVRTVAYRDHMMQVGVKSGWVCVCAASNRIT